MYKLKNRSQNYAWGKKGKDSLISKYSYHQGDVIDDNKAYAELWMGTHPNAPSLVSTTTGEILLHDYIKKELPILFKVLSINKPLSIQVHPDQVRAEDLNKKFPLRYKDKNRKPEMAIALSDSFEMFYGIKSLSSVRKLLKDERFSFILKMLDIKIPVDEINEAIYLSLLERILFLNNSEVKQIIDELVDKPDYGISDLFTEFSYDKGIIFSLFMNRLTLSKGECIFIDANIPHSYIKGDIIECMVNSDFVIRLGLTPKETDVDSFAEILKDTIGEASKEFDLEKNVIIKDENDLKIYQSDKINDFKIIKLNSLKGKYYSSNESILIVTELPKDYKLTIGLDSGKIIQLTQYDTYFINSDTTISYLIESDLDTDRDFGVYIATY